MHARDSTCVLIETGSDANVFLRNDITHGGDVPLLLVTGETSPERLQRVRENMQKQRGRNLLKVLNSSLNQMLSRTLLTGGTTILASLMLYLVGGDDIKGFSFIMRAGIIIGTYW